MDFNNAYKKDVFSLPFTAKSKFSSKTFICLLADFAVMFLSGGLTYVDFFRGKSENLYISLIPAAFFIIGVVMFVLMVCYIAGGVRLTVDHDGVSIKKLFGKKVLLWNEISDITVRSSSAASFSLIITSKNAKIKHLSISQDVFGKQDYEKLYNTIRQKINQHKPDTATIEKYSPLESDTLNWKNEKWVKHARRLVKHYTAYTAISYTLLALDVLLIIIRFGMRFVTRFNADLLIRYPQINTYLFIFLAVFIVIALITLTLGRSSSANKRLNELMNKQLDVKKSLAIYEYLYKGINFKKKSNKKQYLRYLEYTAPLYKESGLFSTAIIRFMKLSELSDEPLYKLQYKLAAADCCAENGDIPNTQKILSMCNMNCLANTKQTKGNKQQLQDISNLYALVISKIRCSDGYIDEFEKIINNKLTFSDDLFNKVNCNYYLGVLAFNDNDKATAERRFSFVLAYGGTTYYVERAQEYMRHITEKAH